MLTCVYLSIVVSLKQSVAATGDVRVIDRVWEKLSENYLYFKSILSFRLLFQAELISEAEFSRREIKEKEKKSVSCAVQHVRQCPYCRLKPIMC